MLQLNKLYKKNMEKVNKDEIYYVEQGNFWMIGLVINPDNEESDSESCRGDATFINSNKRFNINSCWCYHTLNRTNRLASEEEQHWLRECIRLNKYIEKDEAMKTFIPEYVECIKSDDSNKYRLNKILFDKWNKNIEPLPQFRIIEFINTITKVENGEGNQFFMGDVITPVEGVNKGKKFVISGFRYNKTKTNICAITKTHSPNGIGIDKIEHYIEPKVEVEETLLEKAKRLYPIGTKFNNYKLVKGGNWTVEVLTNNIIKESGTIKLINPEFPINNNRGNWTLYKNGEWAEIIND